MLMTLLVAGGALALVLISHYWTLWGLAFLTPADDAGNHKRSLAMLLLLASSHLAHMAGYAVLFYVLIGLGGWGGFEKGVESASDLLYASATAYTTLGFASNAPEGALRLVAALEGLAGFMALTWSATFVYSAFRSTWRH
jgi:Ion channel